MRGQRVPSFLYNAVTVQTAVDWDGVSELKLMKYLGNVVWNGIIANFLTWVPFIFFPWLTLVATGLRQDESAHLPVLLVCFLCFGSTITYNVWLEFKSLKDVLPCVLRVATPTVLGCEVPWYVFLVNCVFYTLICHLDTMTNALFLAKLFTSPNRQHLIFGLITVGYAGVLLWLMMLGQAFFVLLSVYPIGKVVNWEVNELRILSWLRL